MIVNRTAYIKSGDKPKRKDGYVIVMLKGGKIYNGSYSDLNGFADTISKGGLSIHIVQTEDQLSALKPDPKAVIIATFALSKDLTVSYSSKFLRVFVNSDFVRMNTSLTVSRPTSGKPEEWVSFTVEFIGGPIRSFSLYARDLVNTTIAPAPKEIINEATKQITRSQIKAEPNATDNSEK